MQAEKLLDAINGPGYPIYQHQDRILNAYVALTNATTAEDAATALKELRASSADCEAVIRKALYEYNCPQALVVNINKFAYRNWTLDVLSGLWCNARHYLARFIHSQGKEAKVKELTSLYFLVKDMAECAQHIKPEAYRKNVLTDRARDWES